MIKKINRITKKKEIDTVYKQGKSFYSEAVGIKTLPNKLKQKRFVSVVSTKVSKLATERNRIKRIIKSIIIENMGLIKNGQDYFIIMNPAHQAPDRKKIESSLLRCLKKLGCI